MKAIIRTSLFIATVVMVATTGLLAQRVIKGTVYLEGKPAAGITVEAHKGGLMMTSFDGKYEVSADAKSKYLKFTFIDDSKRLDLVENSGDNIDFAFDGNMPGNGGEEESADINLQSAEELIRSQNTEFRDELSLYNEFYKQEDYKSAIPHWRKLYEKYPKSTLNLYHHGIKMYEYLVENAKSIEERDKALQEMMKIYDKRVKYYGQKGYVMGRKGTTWLQYQLDSVRNLEDKARTDAMKSGYEWLSESVKEQGEETEVPILVVLMQTSGALFKMGALPKEAVVSNYDKCISIINNIISKNTDAERVAGAKEAQPYIEAIFGRSGAADCEALVNIFTIQFKERSNDVDFIKSMLRRLGRARCDESQLFLQATEKLYTLEPSAEAAFNMARRNLKLNDAAKAKEYYKQAMSQETDKDLLATYYYEYAYFIYAKENAYSEARNYARKALEINPNYCDALMLIGDIYVASSRTFSDDNFDKATVFWVAVDYYERARRSDDCAIDAAKKIADYRKYFPNKEEGFMRSLQDGKTYKVEGWINETTKARF